MQGALAHRNGVLYVGRHAKTAWVRAFDLDGRPLETSFSLRDEVVGRSSVEALAIDEDHRLWLADGAAGKLRAFTLFGREVACVEDEPLTDGEREDSRGRIGTPSGLAVDGSDDELVVADLDMDLIQEVRDTWQFYRDRRPETYGDLTRLLP